MHVCKNAQVALEILHMPRISLLFCGFGTSACRAGFLNEICNQTLFEGDSLASITNDGFAAKATPFHTVDSGRFNSNDVPNRPSGRCRYSAGCCLRNENVSFTVSLQSLHLHELAMLTCGAMISSGR